MHRKFPAVQPGLSPPFGFVRTWGITWYNQRTTEHYFNKQLELDNVVLVDATENHSPCYQKWVAFFSVECIIWVKFI
jgi:hypothetical protein